MAKVQKKYLLAGLLIVSAATAGSFAFYAKESYAHDEIARVAHYRFPTIVRADLDKEISGMEKKVKGRQDAIDFAILSALYFSQGRLTGNSSWFDQAAEAAQASLKLQPIGNGAAKMTLAKLAENRHDFREAIHIAEEAFKADPSKLSSINILATSHLAIGDLDEAGRRADFAVDRAPGLESYGLRALVMGAQGRDEECVADFEHALEIEDIGDSQESARVRSLFARHLMHHGDFPHAHLLLNEALRAIPNYHLALDLQGELAERENNYPLAEKEFKAAFESSKQLAYLTHLSHLKVLMGNKELAEEIQAQSELLLRAEIAKNGIGHRLDLATVLLDRGRPQDIREGLKLAIEDVANRHNVLPLGILARAYILSGKIPEARETMREVLRSGIREPDYYEQMSMIEGLKHNGRLVSFYHNQALAINAGQPLVPMVGFSLVAASQLVHQ